MTATLFKLMLFATLGIALIISVSGLVAEYIAALCSFVVDLRFALRHKMMVKTAIEKEYYKGPAAVCAKCGKHLDRQSSLMAYNLDKAHADFYCHECYDWKQEDKDHIAVYWEVE